MKLPVVWHTNLLFWADGFTVCPWLVLIRPEYRDNKALLEHELVHVAQQRKIGWAKFWWQYAVQKPRRQEFEVEAHRKQAQVDPSLLFFCARYLSTRYGLDLTYEQALALLTAP